ncbi:MAG: hypothetical protein WD883_00960 [Candidatus Colwellbacteria bacterium]
MIKIILNNNMDKLTLEETAKLYDNLPQPIKYALDSEKFSVAVDQITEKHHLGWDRSGKVRFLVAGVLFGSVHPEDLVERISSEVGVDPRVARDLSGSIERRILAPLAQSLNETHGFHLVVPAANLGPATQQLNELTKPQLQPEEGDQLAAPTTPPQLNAKPDGQIVDTPKQPSAPTPFVLHEHQSNGQSPDQTQQYEGGLVRPSFFEPTSGASYENESAPSARLEIGSQNQDGTNQTARVGKEEANIVHYSAPDTPADPFAAQPPKPPQAKPEAKPHEDGEKNVPPENVIDLKDLPK